MIIDFGREMTFRETITEAGKLARLAASCGLEVVEVNPQGTTMQRVPQRVQPIPGPLIGRPADALRRVN